MGQKYMTKAQYSNAKRQLTRVTNKYMDSDPQAVIDYVTATLGLWDSTNTVYPDDWHRWDIARSDAETKLRYAL